MCVLDHQANGGCFIQRPSARKAPVELESGRPWPAVAWTRGILQVLLLRHDVVTNLGAGLTVFVRGKRREDQGETT